MNLSVCLIAYNEEAKLPRTLESVAFADEIIVVDCESSDNTAKIAKSAGAWVYSRPNLVNLNVNKNFSFDQAKCEFILCLDADEIIPLNTAGELKSVILSPQPMAGYFLPRRNFWMGKWLKHGGQYPDWQLRLFRKGKGRFPEAHVHERLKIDGAIGKLHQPMDHHPYESLTDCLRKLDFYTDFEAKVLYETGLKPSISAAFNYLYWKPSQRYIRRFIFKAGFLDGKAGWEAMRMDMQNWILRYKKFEQLVEQQGVIK
jgi:glycosyltransferase involved in cell wall biosynthesis